MSKLKAEILEIFTQKDLQINDLKTFLLKVVDKIDNLEMKLEQKSRVDFDKPAVTFIEFVKKLDIDRDLSFKDLNIAIKDSIENWLKNTPNKPIIQNGNKIMIFDEYSWRNIKIKDYKLVYNSIARSLSKKLSDWHDNNKLVNNLLFEEYQTLLLKILNCQAAQVQMIKEEIIINLN